MHKTFRPEFLNRIDSIVFFNRLSKESVADIAQIQISRLQKRLERQQITLHIDPAVVQYLAEEGFQPEFGARPLKRTIQQMLTIPLSQVILKNPEKKELNAIMKNGIVDFE